MIGSTLVNNKKKNKKKLGDLIIDYEKKLGSGQFGQVYEGINQVTQQIVAVKQIDKRKLQDQGSVVALTRQIEIMKKLKSPNIIKFINFIQSPNNLYIVQQLANNGHLGNFIQKFGRFQQKIAIQILWQMLNGFKQLAKNGIIHRDIKPKNILLKDNIIKIADFGLSRQLNINSQMLSSGVGTINYMSPQIMNPQSHNSPHKYTYKCDIWSFGVLSYELIAGDVPWKNMLPIMDRKYIYQSIKNQIQAGIEFPNYISENYRNLVKGCLQFEEETRFNWNSISNHPLFQQKRKNCQSIKISQQKFILSEIRFKIHNQNINVENFMKKIPQNITQIYKICRYEQYTTFMQCIDQNINNEQTQKLYKQLLVGCKNAQISQKDILESFQNHHINIKGSNKLFSQPSENLNIIFQKFRTDIGSQDIDFFKIFKNFQAQGRTKLSQQQCKQLFSNILSNLSNEQIQQLIVFFNPQNMNNIRISSLFSKLCKILQVPKITNQKLWRQVQKMEKRKSA